MNIWDKLQKRECRTVNHSFETLPHCLNVATLCLFCWYCLGRCSSELAELFPLPYLSGRSTRYSNWLHDLLDVLMMSLSAVSFPAQEDCGILCLQNAFPWLIIEMVLKETMPRFSYFAGLFLVNNFAAIFEVIKTKYSLFCAIVYISHFFKMKIVINK